MNDSSDDTTKELRGDLVVIQRNPVSGSGLRTRLLRDLIRELRNRNLQVRLFARRDRLDDFIHSMSAPQRLRCLVAAGGDGTITSLVSRHAHLPIIPLPMGTENLVAQHLGIPAGAAHAAHLIRNGHSRLFDTAQINTNRFLLMASAGVDAAIVERLHSARSGNIRRWNYAGPILHTFATWDYPEIQVRSLDDETCVRGSHIVVANLPEYGFGVRLTPDADPTDGLLDVRVFQGFSTWRTIVHAAACRFGMESQADVVRFRARELRVESVAGNGSQEPAAIASIPVQADGDPAGRLPVDIRVNPGAMRLIVPAS